MREPVWVSPSPGEKKIPVFAVTGFAMEAEKEKAADTGLDGYIVKPFGVRELIGTLARHFEKTSPSA